MKVLSRKFIPNKSAHFCSFAKRISSLDPCPGVRIQLKSNTLSFGPYFPAENLTSTQFNSVISSYNLIMAASSGDPSLGADVLTGAAGAAERDA